MRPARFLAPVLLVAAASFVTAAPDKIDLTVVKYRALGDAIRAHKGKVVVVDIWAMWCKPCRAEFHHLVELHKEYADKGLVCISVTVDAKESREKALKFLNEKGATFANYLLDEPQPVWQDKLAPKGIPAVFVFDRKGFRVGKLFSEDDDNPLSYDKHVKPLVKKLLDEK